MAKIKRLRFGEEIFRRLVFGAELIASNNFQLRFGYNHLLRQELRLATTSGGSGFSFGFVFKVKDLNLLTQEPYIIRLEEVTPFR